MESDIANIDFLKSRSNPQLFGKLEGDGMEQLMTIGPRSTLFSALILTILGIIPQAQSEVALTEDNKAFIREELAWREIRDKEMRAPTSWLNIAGLFWLKEGVTSFGTSKDNPIRLPDGAAPLLAGRFFLDNGTVSVKPELGIELKVNGKKSDGSVLRGDEFEKPDIVELNDLRMWVIKRFDRYAIRLRDLKHKPFLDYKGLDFYPPHAKYKIQGEFHSFPAQKSMEVGTVVGENTEMKSPGYVTFDLEGKAYRLDAFGGKLKGLFIVFGDTTNGKETYEAARFLDAEVSENGKVTLNFNRAYNPPCAYTPYATCPLPPPQNQLNIPIPAGEKKYPGSHH
jgi:uncharacterized protein (DUF1684 family)